MDNLKLIHTVHSTKHPMMKLIYTLYRPGAAPVNVEVSSRKQEGRKDILCVPTQTNCAQACTFCHTTGLRGKLAVDNLSATDIEFIVRESYIDSGLADSKEPLLVSFMGVGEPVANWMNLIHAMMRLKVWALKIRLPIRFGLATMLPKQHVTEFDILTKWVATLRLPLKVHFSLHYTTDGERHKYMPTALNIADSLKLIDRYRTKTGNDAEIHYTLIDQVNDRIADISRLSTMLEESKIPVKFLQYNPVPGDDRRSPDVAWTEFLMGELTKHGIPNEWYDSPGADIAAACGMFAVDSYFPPAPDPNAEVKTFQNGPFIMLQEQVTVGPRQPMRNHDGAITVELMQQAFAQVAKDSETKRQHDYEYQIMLLPFLNKGPEVLMAANLLANSAAYGIPLHPTEYHDSMETLTRAGLTWGAGA